MITVLAPRYSAFSDSRMSMSTLEESTPSLTSDKGWPPEGEGAKEMTEGGDELAWQERCMELEESLASFRDQANRIREILKEKVRKVNITTIFYCGFLLFLQSKCLSTVILWPQNTKVTRQKE